MSDVRIVMTAHGRGRVYVDGREIQGVTELAFSAGAKEPNALTLRMHPDSAEIDGLANVSVVQGKYLAELLALAKEYASACVKCNGSGVETAFYTSGDSLYTRSQHVVCHACGHIRSVIRKVEGP